MEGSGRGTKRPKPRNGSKVLGIAITSLLIPVGILSSQLRMREFVPATQIKTTELEAAIESTLDVATKQDNNDANNKEPQPFADDDDDSLSFSSSSPPPYPAPPSDDSIAPLVVENAPVLNDTEISAHNLTTLGNTTNDAFENVTGVNVTKETLMMEGNRTADRLNATDNVHEPPQLNATQGALVEQESLNVTANPLNATDEILEPPHLNVTQGTLVEEEPLNVTANPLNATDEIVEPPHLNVTQGTLLEEEPLNATQGTLVEPLTLLNATGDNLIEPSTLLNATGDNITVTAGNATTDTFVEPGLLNSTTQATLESLNATADTLGTTVPGNVSAEAYPVTLSSVNTSATLANASESAAVEPAGSWQGDATPNKIKDHEAPINMFEGTPIDLAHSWHEDVSSNAMDEFILVDHSAEDPAELLEADNSTSDDAEDTPEVFSILAMPLIVHGISSGESRHFIWDGINESPYLTFAAPVPTVRTQTKELDPVDLTNVTNYRWLFDAPGMSFVFNSNWCAQAVKFMRQVEVSQDPTEWPLPVWIVNCWDDPNVMTCPELERLVGKDNVRYTQRSIIQNRSWNDTSQWVNVGNTMPLGDVEDGRWVQHEPLPVRTDIVVTMENILKESNRSLSDAIEAFDRPVDVAFYWNQEGNPVLRDTVLSFLKEMQASNETDWNMYLQQAGYGGEAGRQGVDVAYVSHMLQTKIIVVAQRDPWEDHFRLFEALVSGAMVMTDTMLSLPEGLEAGTSIVQYGSLEELEEKLTYFLEYDSERIEIARQGRLVSMFQHRSWHRLEALIFGAPIVICDDTNSTSCLFVAHANETLYSGQDRGVEEELLHA